MNDQQYSIEGQTIIKAIGEILSNSNLTDKNRNVADVIKELFECFATELDNYKKKGVT